MDKAVTPQQAREAGSGAFFKGNRYVVDVRVVASQLTRDALAGPEVLRWPKASSGKGGARWTLGS